MAGRGSSALVDCPHRRDPDDPHGYGAEGEGEDSGEDDQLVRFGVPVEALGAAQFLVPRRGENPLAYRDRVLPVAVAAAEPFRQRLEAIRSRIEDSAALDAAQQRALQDLVDQTAEALVDRAFQAAFSGELMPSRLRPANVVRVARDVLTLLDDANRTFLDSLSDQQRAILDQERFDMIEYLLVATRWESIIPGLQ